MKRKGSKMEGWIGIALFLIAGLITICICAIQLHDAQKETMRVLDAWKAGNQEIDKTLANDREIIKGLQGKIVTLNRALTATVQDNASLSKDISEMEDELTESRSLREPFDPETATAVQILAQIVAAECDRFSTYMECRWTAQVIVNRQYKYNKTMKEIVLDPGQFTPVTTKSWTWATPTVIESAAAWNASMGVNDGVIGMEHWPEVLYFCNVGSEDEFFKTKLQWCFTIGHTSFYQEAK